MGSSGRCTLVRIDDRSGLVEFEGLPDPAEVLTALVRRACSDLIAFGRQEVLAFAVGFFLLQVGRREVLLRFGWVQVDLGQSPACLEVSLSAC